MIYDTLSSEIVHFVRNGVSIRIICTQRGYCSSLKRLYSLHVYAAYNKQQIMTNNLSA